MADFNELPVSNDPSPEPLDNAPIQNTDDILDIAPNQVPERKYDDVVNLSESRGVVNRGDQITYTTQEVTNITQGGSAEAAGSTGQIQFNTSDNFDADVDFTYSKALAELTVGNLVIDGQEGDPGQSIVGAIRVADAPASENGGAFQILAQNATVGYSGGDLELYAGVTTDTLGSELVTNGNFTGNATGWTLGTGWAYNSNNVLHTAGNTADLSQTISITNGVDYRVLITVGGTAGSVDIKVGSLDTPQTVLAGAQLTYLISNAGVGTAAIYITPTSDFNGTVDSISVKTYTGGGSGGNINILAGNTDSGAAGSIVIRAGLGGGGNEGGYSYLIGGASTVGGDGGAALVTGGAGNSAGDGGDVILTPGNGGASGKTGDVYLAGTTSLATTSSGGFPVVKRCAGTPTGTPVAGAMIYDSTNNILYIYNSGWKSVALT